MQNKKKRKIIIKCSPYASVHHRTLLWYHQVSSVVLLLQNSEKCVLAG